jgi:DNA-binding response OmpR family regulator
MQNRKIVIIDEDKEMLERLEDILSMSGYVPTTVLDPHLATDTIIESKPDIILMELRMSRKNGFVLADEINREFKIKRTPIIAMAEFFKEEFNWLLNICGIRSRIKKPFLPLEVIWTIENEMVEMAQWNRMISPEIVPRYN